MTTKMKNKTDKTNTDTNTKVVRLIGDVAFTATMITCAVTLMLFALMIAQKITITVGK